jgi:hypothetical protein
VDSDPGKPLCHPQDLHPLTASLVGDPQQGQSVGGCSVHPLQLAVDVATGLVKVGYLRRLQLAQDLRHRWPHPLPAPGHHGHQRSRRDLDPVHVTKQLGHPFVRQVLVDGQIARHRVQLRPVLNRGLSPLRKRRLGHVPAVPAAQPEGSVLRGLQPWRWRQIQHVPLLHPLLASRLKQAGAALLAEGGQQLQHPVRVGDRQ